MVKSALRRAGWELRQTRLEGWSRDKLAPLSEASTIIDVGVFRGTPDLYAAFPDAYLLLLDPLPESEPFMRQLTRARRGSYDVVAVSDRNAEATINVTAGASASTLHTRRPTTAAEDYFTVVDEHRVRTATLDSIVADRDLPAPHLLKIDTEGHELNVLRGATETLRSVDCVIAEVSVGPRFEDSYEFSEVVGLLGDAGFELADVLTLKRDIPTTRVRFLDAAFTRRGPGS
jgi:FkbM family methyltransferase